MDPVRIAILGLAGVLVIIAVWRTWQQRVDFVSKRHYVARNAGTVLMLAAAGLVFAHTRFGYSGRLLVAAALVCWVAAGLLFWGNRGYRPKSKTDGGGG